MAREVYDSASLCLQRLVRRFSTKGRDVRTVSPFACGLTETSSFGTASVKQFYTKLESTPDHQLSEVEFPSSSTSQELASRSKSVSNYQAFLAFYTRKHQRRLPEKVLAKESGKEGKEGKDVRGRERESSTPPTLSVLPTRHTWSKVATSAVLCRSRDGLLDVPRGRCPQRHRPRCNHYNVRLPPRHGFFQSMSCCSKKCCA